MSDLADVSRKLVAVFAADVEGYSRLMGIDEVGTLKCLTERRAILDRLIGEHRGRIANTAGDSVLAEFGSAVDAVKCAVDAQAALAEANSSLPSERRINFRMGIHIGDVMVRAGDLFGDGVNIAARLQALAQPGGVCISGATHDQVRKHLPVTFVDLGAQQVKNIDEPVRAFSVIKAEGRELTPSSRQLAPPHLSIVVLPFTNIGADRDQEYFADGVTESLTTDLSLISGFFVIARNTAFTLKGKPVDVKKIGRELNVRYVLEGSVQRGGQRLRLNAQLLETETGKHLWAERFDKPIADLLDMQDEIVSRLANSLRAKLVEAEAQRLSSVQNPTSIDLHIQGWALVNSDTSPNAVLKAGDYFERALAIDPSNIDALVGKASVLSTVGVAIMGNDGARQLAKAEEILTEALSRSPQHPVAHLCLGAVYIFTGRPIQGIAECERALALDRNIATAHAFIGHAKRLLGREDETEAHVNEALRISPRDNFAFWWMNWVGFAKMRLGKFNDAALWFRRAIESNRNYSWPHLGLAGALMQLGEVEAAKMALQQARAVDPNLTLEGLRAKATATMAVSDEKSERFLNSLLRAGMPEA